MEAWSNSPKQTQKIAEGLAENLKGGEVIALFGQLGAGKTVFVKGLARALGIKRLVTSPTFVFIKSYAFKRDKKLFTFYHLDLYRLETGKPEGFSLDEIIAKNSIVVIEWADKISRNLPNRRIDVKITTEDETKRQIKITRN